MKTRLLSLSGADMKPYLMEVQGVRMETKGEVLCLQHDQWPAGKRICILSSQPTPGRPLGERLLPLLREGQTYELAVDLSSQPQQSVLVQLAFFDRFGNCLDQVMLRQAQRSFICPVKTASYQLSLHTAGCRQLDIRRLELFTPSSSYQFSGTSLAYHEENLPEELGLVRQLLQLKS